MCTTPNVGHPNHHISLITWFSFVEWMNAIALSSPTSRKSQQICREQRSVENVVFTIPFSNKRYFISPDLWVKVLDGNNSYWLSLRLSGLFMCNYLLYLSRSPTKYVEINSAQWFCVREVCRKSKWKFKMAFAMKGRGVSRGSRVWHTYSEKWFSLKPLRIIPWLWKRVLHLVWALYYVYIAVEMTLNMAK